MKTLAEWSDEVDSLCKSHLACGWNDLCGDNEPLQRAFENGESPSEFVSWFAEKYDLDWLKPLSCVTSGYTGVPARELGLHFREADR